MKNMLAIFLALTAFLLLIPSDAICQYDVSELSKQIVRLQNQLTELEAQLNDPDVIWIENHGVAYPVECQDIQETIGMACINALFYHHTKDELLIIILSDPKKFELELRNLKKQVREELKNNREQAEKSAEAIKEIIRFLEEKRLEASTTQKESGDISREQFIAGTWDWEVGGKINGYVVVEGTGSSGTLVGYDPQGKQQNSGNWEFDEEKDTYKFKWKIGKWEDTLTLDDSGMKLTGSNNNETLIEGKRRIKK